MGDELLTPDSATEVSMTSEAATVGTATFDPALCNNATTPAGPLLSGYVTEWITAYNYVKTNFEKLVLYLLLSVTVALMTFLAILSVRLYCQKRRVKRQVKMNNTTESMPIGFNDELSDVDGDIELTAPPAAPVTTSSSLHLVTTPVTAPLEVTRYANGGTSRPGTLRRQDSDTSPRTLYRNPTNCHMYS